MSADRTLSLLLLPALALLLVLFALPIVALLAGSVAGSGGFSLGAYEKLLGQSFYLGVIWNSLKFALLTTLFALLLGYPAAIALSRAQGPVRSAMLVCLLLPLSIGVVVKAFAWTVLLRSDGVVNRTLLFLGIVDEPIRLIFTEAALVIGAVNIFLPFMVLPIYTVVAQIDRRLGDAAATLGAPPALRFLLVLLPLSLPGIIAGVALVFALAISAYVVPTLLIGERYQTLPTVIAKAYLLTREPAFGAAAGVVLLAIALAVVLLSARFGRSRA